MGLIGISEFKVHRALALLKHLLPRQISDYFRVQFNQVEAPKATRRRAPPTVFNRSRVLIMTSRFCANVLDGTKHSPARVTAPIEREDRP
jgi:hypothetical protein